MHSIGTLYSAITIVSATNNSYYQFSQRSIHRHTRNNDKSATDKSTAPSNWKIASYSNKIDFQSLSNYPHQAFQRIRQTTNSITSNYIGFKRGVARRGDLSSSSPLLSSLPRATGAVFARS